MTSDGNLQIDNTIIKLRDDVLRIEQTCPFDGTTDEIRITSKDEALALIQKLAVFAAKAK